MLLLIGLGLDTMEISVKALDALKSADKVMLEQYTTFITSEYIDYLKKETGKQIAILGRSELEEGAKETLKGADSKTIALLVPGDPLIATTHYSTILNTASKLGIKSKVYQSSSIYSAAVGESGLDVYKFGPPVTIPFWSKNYTPVSFLDSIRKNLMNGQHTLVLLDLDQKERRPMPLEEAVSLLMQAEKHREYGIINDDLKILVMGDVGKQSQEIVYASLNQINKISARFSGKILALVIPSNPSFAEQELLLGMKI